MFLSEQTALFAGRFYLIEDNLLQYRAIKLLALAK
jgi:hypothetical protein